MRTQAEDRLNLEQERVTNYLHSSTEEKLLKVRQAVRFALGPIIKHSVRALPQVVNKELLEMHQTQLMQKESTGLCALLQDDKKEGVSKLSVSRLER